MSTVYDVWPDRARLILPRLPAALLTIVIGIVACLVSVAIGFMNVFWFDFMNGFVGAEETVARGILFSSWLLLVGGAVVIWRPHAFGFRIGDVREHWRLVAGSLVAGAIVTATLLKIVGATPYGDASLFIETVVVPVTEELVFRALLLTALLAVLVRLHPPRTAAVLAVIINGVGFGLAHVANALAIDLGFVIQQMVFAAVLGTACATLMLRTRSVYPAMLLHGVVNAVVVLI